LDTVLDKVREQGMHSLTRSEKRFLRRMSESSRRG